MQMLYKLYVTFANFTLVRDRGNKTKQRKINKLTQQNLTPKQKSEIKDKEKILKS